MTGTLTQRIIRLGVILAATVVLMYLGGMFREALLAAVAAGALYYLCLPGVCFLEKRKFPRVLAIILVFLVLLSIVTLLLLYIIPIVIEQLTSLIQDLPAVFSRIQDLIGDIERRLGRAVSEAQVNEILNRVAGSVSDLAGRATSSVLSTAANAISFLFVLVAGAVAAFYLLKDREGIRRYLKRYIPWGSQGLMSDIAGGVDRVLAGFLRGQIIVASIVGTLVGLALTIIGLPYAFILGVLAAMFELVPYIGPILAAIPAVLLALAISPGTALIVGIAFLAIQQIESLILSPRIVGAQVHVHPVTIIFAVMVGSSILGILGIFLAIPIAGTVKVIIERFLLPQDQRKEASEEQEENSE